MQVLVKLYQKQLETIGAAVINDAIFDNGFFCRALDICRTPKETIHCGLPVQLSLINSLQCTIMVKKEEKKS